MPKTSLPASNIHSMEKAFNKAIAKLPKYKSLNVEMPDRKEIKEQKQVMRNYREEKKQAQKVPANPAPAQPKKP